MDLVWLDGRPVMNIRDSDTRSQNAAFIIYKTLKYGLQYHTVQVATVRYSGYPDLLKVDRETACMARDFTAAADGLG